MERWWHERWLPYWDASDSTRRLLIVLGVIGVLALFFGVIAAEPWESRYKDDCEAAAAAEGYSPRSDDFDVMVDFCIDTGEKYGHI